MHHRSGMHGEITKGVKITDTDNTNMPQSDGEQHPQILYAVKKEEEMEMDSENLFEESNPQHLEIHSAQKPDFDCHEAAAVLKALSFNFGTFGDYLVVMNRKPDIIIDGEPYLALQLWFNMLSGKIISRVWSQTVAHSRVFNITQFEEVCTKFFQCRPCVGYILGVEEQHAQDFVISQTPVPRKIYRGCKKVLHKSISENSQSCNMCLRLRPPDEEMPDNTISKEIKADTADSVENKKGKGGALHLANQALYLQEITNKYPHVIKSGRPFKVQIKTEDSKGLLQDKVLLVDPTKTLQQGGLVETLKEEDSIGSTKENPKMDLEQRVNVNDDVFHGKMRSHCVEFPGQSSDEDKQSQTKLACDSEGCNYVTNRKYNMKKHCSSLSHHSSVFLDTENQRTSDEDPQSQKKFACESEGCNYVTNRKYNMKKHCASLSHHSSVFLDTENQRASNEDPQSQKKFVCESEGCSYTTITRGYLRTHCTNFGHYSSIICTNPVNFLSKKCDICEKWILCDGFQHHMAAWHGEKGEYHHHCDLCNKAFSTNGIKRHFKKYHNYGKFACMKCDFVGNFPSELTDHSSKEHTGDNFVRCPACRKDHSMKDIAAHYKICLNEKIRKRGVGHKMCETCGKMIKLRTYNHHIKVHLRKQILNGEENVDTKGKTIFFYCDKCEKRFFYKTQLDDHVRVVHDKLEFKCELCPMTFKSAPTMRLHKKMAHEETRYECEVCHMKFAFPGGLKVHKLVHLEAQFECKFCKKTLKTQEALDNHERYHTGEKPFKCVHCTNAYVSRKALRQHLAGAHNIICARGGKVGWKKNKLQEQL